MKAIKKPNKRPFIIAVSAGVLVVIIVAGLAIGTRNAQNAALDQPKYTTILPNSKQIKDLGGWQRISPQTAAPVYTYTDTIDSVSVSVSEQPLPDSLKIDTGTKIADLAKAYNATDKINANGITVYIGTSAKGPQSTIFTKDSLLILIKSQAKIADKSWITYIDSLK